MRRGGSGGGRGGQETMRGGGSGGGRGGGYTNPCLTMHQPWASLLVHGIKRIEGRSWPARLTGRLWIHAAAKVPDPTTIKAMEDFYSEIYAVNGIKDLKFPEHYPVSRLLGCVEIVGCLRREELVCWEEVPESVRLEGQTDFCWLCEQPQKLIVPFEMRGYQGVYNLEKKVFEAAVRGLRPVEGPLPVKFPLPDPKDPFSLKPGSLALYSGGYKISAIEKSSSLSAAIAGARTAATQFSKKDQSKCTISNEAKIIQKSDIPELKDDSYRQNNQKDQSKCTISNEAKIIQKSDLPEMKEDSYSQNSWKDLSKSTISNVAKVIQKSDMPELKKDSCSQNRSFRRGVNPQTGAPSARSAATQFSEKDQSKCTISNHTKIIQMTDMPELEEDNCSQNRSFRRGVNSQIGAPSQQ